MNILNSIHLYPPQHLCGAEFMIHALNKSCKSYGHDVRVLLHQANHYKIKNHYIFDDIDVFPPDQILTDKLIEWSNAMFTHLDYTRWSIGLAAMYKKPLFHLIHNTHTYEEIVQAEKPQYIIYNSNWAKSRLNYNHDSFVLHPPCDFRYYDCVTNPIENEYITLINLNENKGGELLYKIAQLLPHKKFLGVKGSYDYQIIKQLPNVTILEKQIDIREVYKKTRLLIMPSLYESWGRTATEAMCSGIPIICTETGGLAENCGKAGVYVERTAEAYALEIEKLDNSKLYLRKSKESRIRSRELDPVTELALFNEWLKLKVNEYSNK
jgi:glycosyltransferase involved in cell wall biosynthesis